MNNKRFLTIIHLLLEQENYITINYISEQLKVSNKTIRNDLQQVEEWLKDHELKLIKKTGIGILIEGDKTIKLKAMNILQQKNHQNIEYSPEYRKIYIGIKLILTPENCRIYELADELYVSRATIHKDILALVPIFEKYKIKLNRKNNNGISIEGKERYLRNLLVELMSNDQGYQTFTKMVKNPSSECDGSFVFPAVDYTDDEIQDFLQTLNKSNNPYLHHLGLSSLVTILLYIFITFIRVKENHFIQLSEKFIDDLKTRPYYPETRQISECLSEHYHIKFDEQDIRYLQVYFLSLQNSEQISLADQQEAKLLTELLIGEWEKQLPFAFHQDEELKKALYEHLCPAITRFQHGIHVENPLMPEILTLYQHTFEIAKKSIHCIEERYHCHIQDDEIGYFALHLATSLDRLKEPLKTILIFHGSSSASNLLIGKLKSQFSEIEIVRIETYISIYEKDLNDIDLILSTLELQLDTQIPVIIINSLLYDYDISRLKSIIKTLYRKKNDPLQKR